MSWKHTKFEDSQVMRSLERLAQEKGMVKQEAVVKQASSMPKDLEPSNNLMVNIIKLCAGLREHGLDKYANELEEKFINFKQSSSIYETSKETGEDLVDAAHPKGSHKLEGVEGDATVETIVDRHLKMVEVTNKKPTGKLTTAAKIIGAVKVSLGEDNEDLEIDDDELMDARGDLAMKTLFKIKPIMDTLLSRSDTEVENANAKAKILANANAINTTIMSSNRATLAMCTKILGNLNALDSAFDLLDKGDAWNAAAFMGPWALITAPVGVGAAVYRHWDDPQKMEESQSAAGKLDRVVATAKGFVNTARGILQGNKDKKIKEDKQVKQQKITDQKQQVSNIVSKQTLHNQVMTSISKLMNIKQVIQNKNIEPTSKSGHLEWIDKKIQAGVKLSGDVFTDADAPQAVNQYEKDVNTYISSWS